MVTIPAIAFLLCLQCHVVQGIALTGLKG